jgi:hypothetical protein
MHFDRISRAHHIQFFCMNAQECECLNLGGLPPQNGQLPPDLYCHFVSAQEAGCPRGIIPHQERLACRTDSNVFQPFP